GDPGDRLDRRFGQPRESGGAPVLDQPDRDRDAGRERQGDPHNGDDQGPDQGGGEAAGLGFGEPSRGRGGQRRGLPGLDPLDQQVDGDRHRDQAEEQAERPADRQPDAVAEAPGGASLDRAGRGLRGRRRFHRRRGGRSLHHAAPYFRIERRATQPAN